MKPKFRAPEQDNLLRPHLAEILRVIFNAIAAHIATERPSETQRPLPA